MFKFGKKTYIMGILNVTPDSFSDGGEFIDKDKALNHAKSMIKEGADIIDIGAESTRPGSLEISEDEELKRLIPVLDNICNNIDSFISIDTYKSGVAKKVLEYKVDMINDVWGLQRDKEMANVIAHYGAYVCIMHNQSHTNYPKDIIQSIKEFFQNSIKIAQRAGIKDEKIILDPGIGFGKTYEQNIEVMRRISELKQIGYPILLGTSRKSMIGKILDLPPKERVEGTIATTVMGIMQGVDIVRVHDIKENLRAIKVVDEIYRK
ncbi:dihydropteroate synthase [Alkalithermobacter thermoalcaliphilus JW-YL-7 = DSM 7308]|uniref:Dihydropteroate synthase n=1 Tax=Alkalithermobacter thermoalcaliphilus JW-YL-7 = DSM 7308 TaxID=1121328 RepID=A0A150FQ42_CLOPD|nr:dihydropteroate synthase [[Clostridium] paradoxum JW-YL-7 = DSM 7308]SHK62737.1 dihydropteroate synthase [[Clostridium] paradoxum JW-YL-7 = DSM 7308]